MKIYLNSMLWWFIGFSAITSLGNLGWSQESVQPEQTQCSSPRDVDLREEFCPMRDQDSVGWCYAFAAADMMTLAYHRSIGKKDCNQQVSALHAGALSIKAEKNNQALQQELIQKWKKGIKTRNGVADLGGNTDEVLKLMQTHGLCFENQISSQDNKYAEMMKEEDWHGKFNADMREIHFAKAQGQNACEVQSSLQSLFPSVAWEQLANVFDQTTVSPLLDELSKLACPEPLKVKINKLVAYEKNKKNGKWNRYEGKSGGYEVRGSFDPIKILDEQIGKRFPVGLSIQMSLLKGQEGRVEDDNSDEGHAVTLVGRKLNCETGEEEYILRNSWGGKCSSYKTTTPAMNEAARNLENQIVLQSEVDDAKAWIENDYSVGRQGWVNALGKDPRAEEELAKWDRFYEIKQAILVASQNPENVKATREEKMLAYDKIWQQVQEQVSAPFLNPDISKCEDGYIFISKEKLRASLHGFDIMN